MQHLIQDSKNKDIFTKKEDTIGVQSTKEKDFDNYKVLKIIPNKVCIMRLTCAMKTIYL